jgi:hypothetical protein
MDSDDMKTVMITIQIAFLIYLLTPWSRVLLEKLTGSQLVMKFPEFYGIRKFTTTFTSAHHLSLSCAQISLLAEIIYTGILGIK